MPPPLRRRRLRERAEGEEREERGARLPFETGEALEETFGDVVLLRPAHPQLSGERSRRNDGDRGEEVDRALTGVLRLAGRGVGRDREDRGDALLREVDDA